MGHVTCHIREKERVLKLKRKSRKKKSAKACGILTKYIIFPSVWFAPCKRRRQKKNMYF